MVDGKFTELEAIDKLRRLGIEVHDRIIYLPKERPVGIKTWGIVDFLCNHRGLRWKRARRGGSDKMIRMPVILGGRK